MTQKHDKALFAAGCFWGVQYYFDQMPGVIRTTVGYSGGDTQDPTYTQVCTGRTGHAESVLIEYDPKQVSYKTLLRHFFKMHDPTQLNRQGPDVGSQYRSAVFYFDGTQQDIAESEKECLDLKNKKPIKTEIVPAINFYPAETYHQKYAEKTGRGTCNVPYKPLT